MHAVATLLIAYLVGSIPFSNLLARTRGVDLRSFGTGTVSGTSLFRATGFAPMAVAGVLDIAKGVVGPLVAGRWGHPALAIGAAGVTVVGHNWSIFLRGAGGRGISPALGATAVLAWPATVVLAAGLAGGRLARQTGLGCFVALVALVPALALARGPRGALLGAALALPMLVKRATGNGSPFVRADGRTLAARLLYDREGTAV